MNKRVLALVISCLALAFVFVSAFAGAQDASGLVDEQTIQQVEGVQQKYGEFASESDKEAYLSREWTTLLQKNQYTNWIYKLDPVFSFLFGYPFSLSWIFVAALLLWVLFFSIFEYSARYFSKNDFVVFGVALACSVIGAHGITPKLLGKLPVLLTSIWYNLGFLVALLFFIVLFRTIAAIYLRAHRNAEKSKEVKKLKTEVKKTSEVVKEVEEVKEGAEEMKKGTEEYKYTGRFKGAKVKRDF